MTDLIPCITIQPSGQTQNKSFYYLIILFIYLFKNITIIIVIVTDHFIYNTINCSLKFKFFLYHYFFNIKLFN